MEAAEFECSGACEPDAACSVRELAAASEWQRAADRISRGNSCCLQCLEQVVQTAMQHQQWDCVVRLLQRCTVQEKSELVEELAAYGQWSGVLQLIQPSVTSETMSAVVEQAVKEGQWSGVLQLIKPSVTSQTVSAVVEQAVKEGQWSEALELIKPSVTSETVSAVVEQAVKEGQWGWIKEVVKTGLCGQQQVEWLCQQAVDRQQWDTVMQLLDMGVQSALRNALLQSAVVQHHVPCTAKLIELGVSNSCGEDGIRNEMAKGHGGFVLQVVKTVQDPDLTDFVLQESMRQNQWELVSELVKNKEELCVTQLENVCNNAVACQQWGVALQLLHDGVSPSNWIVDKLFQSNMTQALVDLYPAGCVTDILKGLLLMGSIRHGQGDFCVHLLQRESVSDEELMDAMMYAVHLLDKSTLLKIIRASSRSRRVFKQKFVHQNWKNNLQPLESEYGGGEASWLFNVFSEEGDKDLALHVAASNISERYLIADFCCEEQNHFDLKQRKFQDALRKLHQYDDREYAAFVKILFTEPKTSQADRSFLFRQAVRFGQYRLVADLCEHGVSRKDLTFCVQWLFQTDEDKSIFPEICLAVGTNNGWLKKLAVRFSMREFFKQKTDKCLADFIDQYMRCDDVTFTRHIFRLVVRKCVKFDCANCFVEVCKQQLSMVMGTAQEDCIFAYTSAVTGNRPHFISKVCQEKIILAFSHTAAFREYKLLIDIIFEKEAWNMLLEVSAGLKPFSGSNVPSQVLEYCVQKMLCDEAAWPCVAPVLGQWLSKTDLGDVREEFRSMWELWRRRSFSLLEWCVDSGHANLAFLLALVTKDWELIERLVNTQPSLDLHLSVLRGGVELATIEGVLSAGASILKLCPVNAESLRSISAHEGLAQACADQGLVDWALTLNDCNWTYVEEHHRQCQNPLVLNSLLQTASFHKKWDMTQELLTRCTDSKTLKNVFQNVIEKGGEVDLAEALICHVNPSLFIHFDNGIVKTLLCSVVSGRYKSDQDRLRMVRLCIASGVSSFERNVRFHFDHVTRNHNCVLTFAVETKQLDVIKLIVASGAIPYDALHYFRKNWTILDRKRVGYSCIQEAAATPSRLEHLARLAVSHSIGCQPGREERIQNLPVPEHIRELVSFKDVLSTDTEQNS